MLSREEINNFIQEGKQSSAKQGTAILDWFEKDQPHVYAAIFGEFSDDLAKENPDMANLFLDLCFDIIFVYKRAFGNTSDQSRDENWLVSKLTLLDAELKAIDNEAVMNGKFKERLSERFIERCIEAGIQLELLTYLNEQVYDYAGFKPARMKAAHVTSNLLFVIVRLMDDIYSSK